MGARIGVSVPTKGNTTAGRLSLRVSGPRLRDKSYLDSPGGSPSSSVKVELVCHHIIRHYTLLPILARVLFELPGL